MDRHYGSKYRTVGDYAPATEIAKHMRQDIKHAIKGGSLPGTAKNYRVRCQTYSGGQSINIRAVELPGMWQECDGTIPGTQHVYELGGEILFGAADRCRNFWCAAGDQAGVPGAETHLTLTVEGQRVESILRGIHDAYNHDGSDLQTDYFDVRYYGTADIQRIDY